MYHPKHKRWRYKNTTMLALGLLLFFIFLGSPPVQAAIDHLGRLGYVGAFITGMLFVSTFTVAPAAILLFYFADQYHPVEIALVAGLGSVLGDYILFRFLKDRIFEELAPLFEQYGGSYLKVLFHSPYFSWFSPILGAIIIMSPFPDELGMGLLGLSKIKTWQFFLLTLVLDVTGIFIIVSFTRIT